MDPSEEPIPVPSLAPSGEASAVPTSALSRDPSKFLKGFIPGPSSAPSGEVSAVPNPSPIHDPCKELTGFIPVPSSAPSGEANAVPNLSYPSKELIGCSSPLCIGEQIMMCLVM